MAYPMATAEEPFWNTFSKSVVPNRWSMYGLINEGLCVLWKIMNDVKGVFDDTLAEWN